MKISIWDILSVLALLAAFVIIMVSLAIFADPKSAFNPFPPPTAPAPVVLPTATETPRSLPQIWTVTAEEGVPVQETPRITSTLQPTGTMFVIFTFTPTSTPTLTPTPTRTPTLTPTITLTPTVTLTRTITPTRTFTLPPTNTLPPATATPNLAETSLAAQKTQNYYQNQTQTALAQTPPGR